MTRRNASASTSIILHLLFTLSSPTFAAAFRFPARHDGKSHKNHNRKDLHARQDVSTAASAGTSNIAGSGATVLDSTPTITQSKPLDQQFDTFAGLNAGSFAGVAVPSTTSMTAASESGGQATMTSSAHPVFVYTVIQIPIYTICPDMPGYMSITSTISPNATAPYLDATVTGNATDYLPPRLSATSISINATAVLTNSSHTAFLDQPLSMPASSGITPSPAPNARLVLGTNGCQTLYSASITQICSTVITRGGQLPITVNDCSQLVTFSSSSATAVPTCNCPNMPTCPATPTSPANQTVSGTLISETIAPDPPAGGETSAGHGTVFFAAPWHEIAAGIVPGVVQVAQCADEGANNCSTTSERWSVSTSTSLTTHTQTIKFAGPAIIAHGTNTLTTDLSYSSLHTSTHTLLIPTIVREAITPVTTPTTTTTAENIVTVWRTVPQVRTWKLQQQHSTALVTRVVTVTVARPVRATRTLMRVLGG